jgi:hypothetical protein
MSFGFSSADGGSGGGVERGRWEPGLFIWRQLRLHWEPPLGETLV